MEIGVVGKPNVGKSTFFVSATLAPAEIAPYPFTTIKPNRGIAYLRVKCPHTDFNIQCTPRNSKCQNGIRYVPIELIDVAGLVPDAHKGRGLGNKFLDDLRMAEALIHVVDASGCTDSEGKICPIGSHDPINDVSFLQDEISHWIADIISKGWQRIAKQTELENKKIEEVLQARLTGLGISLQMVIQAVRQSPIPTKPSQWTDDDVLQLAKNIQKISKPMIIAANKHDIAPEENIKKLKSTVDMVVPTSAEFELALRRAAQAGLIEYELGSNKFKIIKPDKLNDKQKIALQKISDFLIKTSSTGVEKCIETAAFKLLDLIVVYPVEDETHLTDKEGRVLPDAFLLRRGSTALDMAFKVHTDIGKNFIRAINARTKRVIGSEYVLQDGDVIKIVAKV